MERVIQFGGRQYYHWPSWTSMVKFCCVVHLGVYKVLKLPAILYPCRRWAASIVDRREYLYLIHYEMWDESTWDEWVTRDRIRWSPKVSRSFEVSKLAYVYICERIHLICVCFGNVEQPLQRGDLVELKCTSSFGRSPWLETEVIKRIDGSTYIVCQSFLSFFLSFFLLLLVCPPETKTIGFELDCRLVLFITFYILVAC